MGQNKLKDLSDYVFLLIKLTLGNLHKISKETPKLLTKEHDQFCFIWRLVVGKTKSLVLIPKQSCDRENWKKLERRKIKPTRKRKWVEEEKRGAEEERGEN